MKEWIREVVEQICIGKILMESKIESGNRLAIIIIDNAVEFGCKFYVSYHTLLPEKELDLSQSFISVLDKIKEIGKLSDKETKDIKTFHKLRNDLYHRAKLTTVKDEIIENYIMIAKELLKRLYDFSLDEIGWKTLINNTRKSLTKEKIETKEPVSYEKVEIEGMKLIRMKTHVDLKDVDSIMLVIYGFWLNYARAPERTELEKSLLVSGHGIGKNILKVRISQLRSSGYLEKNKLELKRKALEKLRKKFLIN
jgi:hypothetical protein